MHSFPTIAFLIDYALLDIKMVSFHAPYLYIPSTILYSLFNYFHTVHITGHPLYYFLTWADYKSLLVIIALCLAFTIIFMVLATVVDYFSGDTIKSRYKKLD